MYSYPPGASGESVDILELGASQSKEAYSNEEDEELDTEADMLQSLRDEVYLGLTRGNPACCAYHCA